MIDFEEFLLATQLHEGPFSKNLFRLFDMNEDGAINFREFLIGFATFSNETIDKQISAAFKLLDPDGSGEVSKETLTEIL